MLYIINNLSKSSNSLRNLHFNKLLEILERNNRHFTVIQPTTRIIPSNKFTKPVNLFLNVFDLTVNLIKHFYRDDEVVLYSCVNPIWHVYSMLIARALFPVKKIKWICEFRDPLVGNSVNKKFPRTLIAWITENLLVIFCDQIIIHSGYEKKILDYKNRYTLRKDKFELSPTIGSYTKTNKSHNTKCINHQKVSFGFLGTVYQDSEMQDSISVFCNSLKRAVASLGNEAEPIEISVNYAGSDFLKLKTVFSNYDLEHVLNDFGFIDDVVQFLDRNYVLVIFQRQGALHKDCVYAKNWDYAKSSRPVLAIAATGGQYEKFFRQNQLGFITNNEGECFSHIAKFIEAHREGLSSKRKVVDTDKINNRYMRFIYQKLVKFEDGNTFQKVKK